MTDLEFILMGPMELHKEIAEATAEAVLGKDGRQKVPVFIDGLNMLVTSACHPIGTLVGLAQLIKMG